MTHSQKAVFFSLLGFFLFSIGDIARKYLLLYHEPLQIQFWSAICSVFVISLFSPMLGGLGSVIRPNKPHLHLIKACLVCSLIIMAIYSLKYLDLATMYTLIFLAPIFSAIGGAIFFKETLKLYHLWALAVGFSGTLIVLRPGFQDFQWAMLLAMGVGLAFSINTLMNKLFPSSDPRLPFGFYPYLLTACVCLVIIGELPAEFTLADIPLLVIAGGASSLAMVAHVIAFQAGPAATAAPYHYSQLIWGALFGYLIFGDVPDLWTWLGAALIIGAGVYLYAAENRLFRYILNLLFRGVKGDG